MGETFALVIHSTVRIACREEPNGNLCALRSAMYIAIGMNGSTYTALSTLKCGEMLQNGGTCIFRKALGTETVEERIASRPTKLPIS